MLVMKLAVQVTAEPPTFPVPLHWLTVIGIAALTLDRGSTVQLTVPPPPLAEPLHWVTVAPEAAGRGAQFTVPPPPVPEPTHWLTATAPTCLAPGVLALMLFMMLTLQLMVCAASLSELLHWLTAVTRLADRVVYVPFGVEQGPSVQNRVTVVVELVALPLTVLTTVTVHFSAVVAPSGPGAWPLHWSITMVAAWASVGSARAPTENPAVSSIRAVSIAAHPCREAGPAAVIVSVLMSPIL
jgi:hypothetical protein